MRNNNDYKNHTANRSMLSLTSPTKLNVIASDWSKIETHKKVSKNRSGSHLSTTNTLINVTNLINIPQRTKLTQSVPPLLKRNSSFFKDETKISQEMGSDISGSLVSTDRFIPIRSNCSTTKCELLETEELPPPNASPSTHLKAQNKIVFKQNIAHACGIDMSQRVLQYMPKPPQASIKRRIYSIGHRVHYQYDDSKTPVQLAKLRKINTNPERILDAPGFLDDFYLNLLSWSPSNILAIALDKSLYLWNGVSGDVSMLTEFENESITSVTWSDDNCHISIGKNDGNTEIWDVETISHIRTMRSGLGVRICSQDWLDTLISTGSKSGEIQINDVRIKNHIINTWEQHSGEVCGMKFRKDGLQLASGGNDNTVMIWDTRQDDPLWIKRTHNAAVKAISWNPDVSNLLATGGGSLDRHIHFWNTNTGARIGSIDTGSQVSSLHWGQSYENGLMNSEIVATGGSPNNCISIYNYETKFKVAEITQAHESRIVSSQLSPDGTTIATVGGDENLKFFKVFDQRKKRLRDSESENYLESIGVGKSKDDDNKSPSKANFIIR